MNKMVSNQMIYPARTAPQFSVAAVPSVVAPKYARPIMILGIASIADKSQPLNPTNTLSFLTVSGDMEVMLN